MEEEIFNDYTDFNVDREEAISMASLNPVPTSSNRPSFGSRINDTFSGLNDMLPENPIKAGLDLGMNIASTSANMFETSRPNYSSNLNRAFAHRQVKL